MARGWTSRRVRGVRPESVGGGKGLRGGTRVGGRGPQGKGVQEPRKQTDEGGETALALRVLRGMRQGCVQERRGDTGGQGAQDNSVQKDAD